MEAGDIVREDIIELHTSTIAKMPLDAHARPHHSAETVKSSKAEPEVSKIRKY